MQPEKCDTIDKERAVMEQMADQARATAMGQDTGDVQGKDYWALRKLDLGIEKSAALCRECTDMPCISMCPRRIRIPDGMEKAAELVRTFYHVYQPGQQREQRCGKSD